MKPNLNNKYGYKVCYTEKHYKKLHERFLTRTYEQAKMVKQGYYLYPPESLNTGRKLIKPKWYIIPITRREVQEGIWKQAPF